MISLFDKAFLCENSFNLNLENQMGITPYYTQYFLTELKRLALANAHFFTWHTDQSKILIGTPSSLEFRGYQDLHKWRNNIVLLLQDYSNLEKFDLSSNLILNFTNKNYLFKKSHYQEISAPYSFRDLTDFPVGPFQKDGFFNIIVFVNSLVELTPILAEWKRRRYYNSSLSVFYKRMTNKDSNVFNDIEAFNGLNNHRRIRLQAFETASRHQLYSAFINAAFSLFLTTDTIFPFWSARLGCFPIVLQEDVASSYFQYLPSKDLFVDILTSFWSNPEELLELSREATQIPFNQMSIDWFQNTVML